MTNLFYASHPFRTFCCVLAPLIKQNLLVLTILILECHESNSKRKRKNNSQEFSCKSEIKKLKKCLNLAFFKKFLIVA